MAKSRLSSLTAVKARGLSIRTMRGMAKRIVVIDAHPDRTPAPLAHALSDAYADGAASAGHEVRRIALGDWEGAFLRSSDEFEAAPSDPFVTAARADLEWCEHLVIVFPLWLGSAPSLLRAFLEQVSRGRFVGDPNKGFATGKLRGKSARLIVTMGMPSLVYRVVFGARGVRSIASSILGFAGVKPVRLTLLGAIEAGGAARYIAKARSLGVEAA